MKHDNIFLRSSRKSGRRPNFPIFKVLRLLASWSPLVALFLGIFLTSASLIESGGGFGSELPAKLHQHLGLGTSNQEAVGFVVTAACMGTNEPER